MSEINRPFFLRGAGGGDIEQPVQRTPIEAPEGVSGQKVLINGQLISVPRAVSLSQIRTVDLISEGEIEGLVSGESRYVGHLGEVGYRSAEFVPFPTKFLNGYDVSWLRSIYWNETPIVDKNNLFNFQQVDVRASFGAPNGASTNLLSDELTVSRLINERLRGPNSQLNENDTAANLGEVEEFAKSYRILNPDARACNVNIRVNALAETIVKGDTAGDVVSAAVLYRIYYKPLFATAQVVDAENVGPEEQVGFILAKEETIRGKITYGYVRSSRVDFAGDFTSFPDFIGWAIKIFRVTPDSVQGFLRNQTYIDSLTEIYGEQFCYPNSAIVSQKFSAEYFSQIPNRAFDTRLLKVKVPNNYDPITKTYDGVWDGTFKTDDNGNILREWTDNPVWCYYDILTNKRYGLGNHIDESLIDKWTLYEISKYCDVLVSNGEGGLEPRFTCNLLISSRETAYQVISDMASIFRAVVYYSNGSIFSSQDAQKNPVIQFTNANVENGEFSYSSSSKRVRHSIAVVRYNDKTNFFRPAVEYVEDVEAIKRFGIRETEVTAFGTTSRGQAIRVGRWALVSESLETDAVSFTAGLEASYLRPGDVFQVFDANRKNKRHGGRTKSIDTNTSNTIIQLDSLLTGLRNSTVYNFSLLTPTFNYDVSQVTGLTSNDFPQIRRPQIQTMFFSGIQASGISGLTQITFVPNSFGRSQAFDFVNYYKGDNLVWMVEASGIDPQNQEYTSQWDAYRAVRIEEKDAHKFQIEAIEYSDSKFLSIESGLNFETLDEVAPLPSPPLEIRLLGETLPSDSSISAVKYTVVPSDLTNVTSFLVYAKHGEWLPEDFQDRTLHGEAAVVSDATPDNRFLINILPINRLTDIFIPLSNGQYSFRAYSRNIQGVPSVTPASNFITVIGINAFNNFSVRSLRLSTDAADTDLGQRTNTTYTTAEPTFNWQAGFSNINANFPVSDVKYRLTFRQSVSNLAANPASIANWPGNPDRYKPSSIIYFEVTGFSPINTTDLKYTFKVSDSIQAFSDWYRAHGGFPTGTFREYDLIVEAHLNDGTSSAGGNFVGGSRGGIRDSDFSNANGYDVLLVQNPSVPAITLTPAAGLDACLLDTTVGQICTDQWLTSDGEVHLHLRKGSVVSDAEGGFIYACTKTFTLAEATALRKTDGTEIERIEFAGTNFPVTVETHTLVGLQNGFMAVAFYDVLDTNFRTEIRKTIPSYNLERVLNISLAEPIQQRGTIQFADESKYRAWVYGRVTYTSDFSNGVHGSLMASNVLGLTMELLSIQEQIYIEYGDAQTFAVGWRVRVNLTPGTVQSANYGVCLTSDSKELFYGRPLGLGAGGGTVEFLFPKANPLRVLDTNLTYFTLFFPASILRNPINHTFIAKQNYAMNFFAGIMETTNPTLITI